MTESDDPGPSAAPNAEPGPEPGLEAGTSAAEVPRTRIIRRAPTGPIPKIPASNADEPVSPDTAAAEDHTETVAAELPAATRALRPPITSRAEPASRTAVAACVVSIVSGWATSVVATEVITGWWRFSTVFCLAVLFLALVFAVTTISGVVLLLQRRPAGRYLIVVGAVVALLTYGSLFIAEARVAPIVRAFPLLPIASLALALHPRTKRWLVG